MYTVCAVCGEKLILPIKCSYCDKYFCDKHRLPEHHNCAGAYEKERSERRRRMVR